MTSRQPTAPGAGGDAESHSNGGIPSGPVSQWPGELGVRDLRLAGRTYAIPFKVVWRAALKVTAGGIRGWRTVDADVEGGVIEVRVRGLAGRIQAALVVTVGLDEDAQTRVDLTVVGPSAGVDARRIRRFYSALDRAVGAAPHQIL